MPLARLLPALAVAALLAVGAAPASAQLSTGVGAGLAYPTGDLGDVYDSGYTIQGRAGIDFLLASVHVNAGWTRFPSNPAVSDPTLGAGDNFDVYQGALGARAGLGLLFVGANVALYAGDIADDDNYGIVPEVGMGFGPLDVVADYRINGEAKWFTVRGELTF